MTRRAHLAQRMMVTRRRLHRRRDHTCGLRRVVETSTDAMPASQREVPVFIITVAGAESIDLKRTARRVPELRLTWAADVDRRACA
jgi:hypothetical protein